MADTKPDKTLKMKPEPHTVIKQYCRDNGLKLARFVEKACLHYIQEAKKNEGQNL